MLFFTLSLVAATFAMLPTARLSDASSGDAHHAEEGNGAFKLTLDEFSSRMHLSAPEPESSLDQTEAITTNMKNGLPIYSLLLETHVRGQNDQSNFLTQPVKTAEDLKKWPDGALAQFTWCNDAANQTMFDAMQACGPAASCDSDFVTTSLWGTLDGMDWAQDGLMLFQCVGVQTIRSQCQDPAKYPCKSKILGDWHGSMWPKASKIQIIGNGATSVGEMAQQIKDYGSAHHAALSPPSGK